MVERRVGVGESRDVALNPTESKLKHKEASKLKANVALINKEKAVVRQKWGREKWITYVGAFMQHRNLMIGVWNNLVKRNEDWDTEQEIQEMFNIEGIRRIPIDGENFGKFGYDWRQKDAAGKVLRTIPDLYDYAEKVVKPEFDELMTYIGLRNHYTVLTSLQDPENVPVGSLLLPQLKSKEMTHAKDKNKYDGNDYYEEPQGPSVSWINDIVRCSFSCASLEDISTIFEAIKDHKDDSSRVGQGLSIVRVKNRFLEPTFGNYRDLVIYVRLKGAGAGFICEIQINHNEFQNYSLQHDSYAYYLYFRHYFSNCYGSENNKRFQARLKCIKKMDQIGTNYDELDRFIKDFLNSGGRVTRDLQRLKAFSDFFLLVNEWDLMEQIQRFLINLLRTMGTEYQGDVAEQLAKLVHVFVFRGEYSKALPIAKEALSLSIFIHGETSMETAEQVHNMAGIFHCQYILGDALPLYKRELDIKRALLPAGHELILASMKQLAEVLEDLQDVETAKLLYEELLPLQVIETGDMSNEVCHIENCLVTIALLRKDYRDAYARLEKLYEKSTSMHGRVHAQVAENLRDMGYILDKWGRWTEALAMFRDALLIRVELRDYTVDRSAEGKDKARTAKSEEGGTSKSSSNHHKEILNVLGVHVPCVPPAEDSLHIADLFIGIANVLCEIDTRAGGPVDGTQGGADWQPHGAVTALTDYDGNSVVGEEKSLSVCDSLSTASQLLDNECSSIDGGRDFNRSMAKTLLDRAVQIRLVQLGDKELPTSAAMNDMAEVLLYQREVTQAKQLLNIAVGLRHSMLGLHSPATKQSHSALDIMYELIEIEKQKTQFKEYFSHLNEHGDSSLTRENDQTAYDDQNDDKGHTDKNKNEENDRNAGSGHDNGSVHSKPESSVMDESSANFESVPEDAEKTVTEIISSYQLDKETMKIDEMMTEVLDCRNAGLLTKAMIICQEATDLVISHYGDAHPAVAIALQQEASIYEDMSHYAAAIGKLEEASTILLNTYTALAPPHEEMSPMHELKAIKERLCASSTNLGNWFDTIDVDGSGTIDIPEFSLIVQRIIPDITRVQLRSLMALADDDGSGEMSKEEFVEFLSGDDDELVECDDKDDLVDFSSCNEYLAFTFLHLGLNHMRLANYNQAIDYLEKALDQYLNIASLYRSHKIPIPPVEERNKRKTHDNVDGDQSDEEEEEGENEEARIERERKEKMYADYDVMSPDRNLHFLQQYPGYITTINLKAQCLHFTHQYEEAENTYWKVLYVKEFCFGTHHLDYSATLNSFGLMQLDRGFIDQAEEMFKRAMKLRDQAVGRNHPAYAEVLHNRALTYAARRNYAYAGKIFEESIEINRTAFGKKSPEVAIGLKCVEALLISQGNESMCGDIREYLKLYAHDDDPELVKRRAKEKAMELKRQEQEIKAHSDARRQIQKDQTATAASKDNAEDQQSALESIRTASVLDLAGVSAEEVKAGHDRVMSVAHEAEGQSQRMEVEIEEYQKNSVPFDPEAVKLKFVEDHQEDFNMLSVNIKQLEIAVTHAYPLAKKFLKVVKFDNEQGDDRSILERVRLYKELKQYADHLAALDDALCDTLDRLVADAPYGVEQLETVQRIQTDLDEKLEFVLLTNEDASADGISEANLHRLNPRVAELNRLPHTYNAVLISTSLAAKDFILAAQAHDDAASAVAPEELDLLRKRVIAYKELERHNYILTQTNLDFMNTVKRHAEFGKAPRSIIVALLRYFEKNQGDRTRIEQLVAQARFDGISASSITMFDPSSTMIPKTLESPVQSVVSSYAPTEVSESDDDSRLSTARSDLEKVFMDEAPELAVKGYMGVGKLTLSKHLHDNDAAKEESEEDQHVNRYKAMIKEGHTIAEEYDVALGSARKDADAYERAVQAHDSDPSSEELLAYRVQSFRAFQKSAAESRRINEKFKDFLQAGDKGASNVMLALQGYYEKMNEEQDAVNKTLDDASVGDIDEQDSLDDRSSSSSSPSSSRIRAHLENIESVDGTISVSLMSQKSAEDDKHTITSKGSRDRDETAVDALMHSARSQADEETDELRQTMIDNYVKIVDVNKSSDHHQSDGNTTTTAAANRIIQPPTRKRMQINVKETEKIRSIHTLVSKYNQSIATAVVCANVFKTSVMEHDKRRQDLNLLLARVRAFIDFTKHVQDLKKANDEFLHMMEQLGEDNKDDVEVPEKVLRGLHEFYEKRNDERELIEDTLIMGKDDGITLKGAKAYRDRMHHGKDTKSQEEGNKRASTSQHSDDGGSDDDDISNLYSSSSDSEEDDDDDDDDCRSSDSNSGSLSTRSDESGSSYSNSVTLSSHR